MMNDDEMSIENVVAGETPSYDDETGDLIWTSVSDAAKAVYGDAHTAALYYAFGRNDAGAEDLCDPNDFAARYARMYLDTEIVGEYTPTFVQDYWVEVVEPA